MTQGSTGRFVTSGAAAATALLVLATVAIFRSGALLPSDRRWLTLGSFLVAFVWLAMVSLWSGPEKGSSATVASWRDPRGPVVQLLPLAALGVYALLSSLWSLDPTTTLWAAAATMAGLAYLRAGQVLGASRLRRRAVVPLFFAALGSLIALASLIAFYANVEQWTQVLVGVRHVLGPFGYANATAGLLTLTIPATVAACIESVASRSSRRQFVPATSHRSSGRPPQPRDRASRLLFGLFAAGLILQGWALYYTRSRGAMLALAGALAVLVLVRAARAVVLSPRLSSTRAQVVAGAACALPAVAIVAAFVASPRLFAAVWTRGLATEHRIKTWEAAIEAAREQPLVGWGGDTFFLAYQPYHTTSVTRFAHNLFLQQWVELGAIGLVLLLAVLAVVVVVPAVRGLRAPMLSWRPLLAWAVLAFVLHNVVDLTWYFPALLFLFLVAGGSVWDTKDAGQD